jgi:hypothetical protein
VKEVKRFGDGHRETEEKRYFDNSQGSKGQEKIAKEKGKDIFRE